MVPVLLVSAIPTAAARVDHWGWKPLALMMRAQVWV